jgi:hypothetical protein
MVRSQAINREPCSSCSSSSSSSSSSSNSSSSSSSSSSSGGGIIGVLKNGDLKMVIEEVNSL